MGESSWDCALENRPGEVGPTETLVKTQAEDGPLENQHRACAEESLDNQAPGTATQVTPLARIGLGTQRIYTQIGQILWGSLGMRLGGLSKAMFLGHSWSLG
ncbi:hypothetical protein BDD12DRAFT_810484 [Trichophaea hybrida]|nr:hypothetical protein BDD12DRAFT_810484 [Trichophaea hybrida]